jgi:hypothetical protein
MHKNRAGFSSGPVSCLVQPRVEGKLNRPKHQLLAATALAIGAVWRFTSVSRVQSLAMPVRPGSGPICAGLSPG